MVEGTTTGTLTDIDGKWTLDGVNPSANLVFTCLGFETVTLPATADVANVVLKEDSQLLEEVVVVGYGVQKKVNVTGAVSSIDYTKQLEGRPVLSTSSSLAGLAPGMSVMQGSGKPGEDGATIRIRGVGSFTGGASSPLVLVDGVEWSMDNVNPNDIASISVLKDAASTSIYGTRAANGVILITTKNGVEAKPRISYSYKGIYQMPYNNLNFVSDYVQYMELYNEGCDNAGTSRQFAQSTIDAWKEAQKNPNALNENGIANYMAYPNTDWFSEIMQNGYSQEHNLSVSGGSKAVKYMISAGYLDNQGVMNRFNLDSSSQKANVRANVEADVTKWFTIGTKILGQFQQIGPANVSNGFNNLYMTTPGVYPGSPNKWGKNATSDESPNANNILGAMAGSTGTNRYWRVNGTLYAKIRPYKGVSIEGTFNYAPTFREVHTYSRENGYWNYVLNQSASTSNLAKASMTNRFYRTYNMSTDLVARYNETFGVHSVGAIVGYSAISYKKWDWGYTKEGATDWGVNMPGTYATLKSDASTAEQGWGIRSYFGRLNYGYDDKYLVEANLRVDGSSKFGLMNRYGIFPSFSAGWRIDQEEFMENTRHWLESLKLRASWGQTGNNMGIGNYAWQATYTPGKVVVDGLDTMGFSIMSLSNANLKWETTSTTDIGIDAAFFKNKLTTEIDYYYKNTTDILFTPSTYLTMGNFTQVPANLGAMWNQGIEIALNWRDGIGKDFNYFVGVNFSYNKNKVKTFKGQHKAGYDENGNYKNNISDVSENWGGGKLCEGHPIGEYYLLSRYKGTGAGYDSSVSLEPNPNAGPVDGMIRTEKDMEWVRMMLKFGYEFNGITDDEGLVPGQLWYGDFIYADTNGDKVYGNEFDKSFTGKSSTPSYNLGINLGFSWKGLDFSMLWSGAFDYHLYWATNYYNSSILTWGYGISQRVADDHYFYNPSDPQDPRTNLNGTYPRLFRGADGKNRENSDFYLYKGDYIKLKNVQLGYSFPQDLTRKIAVEQLRLFVSAENLLTLTSYPGMDPELGTTIGYPLMRQVSFGAQITF